MKISRIGPAHAAVMAALHAACFDAPWDEAACRDVLAMPGSLGLIAEDGDGQPLGFIVLSQIAGEAEIVTIGTAGPAQGQGVARALLAAALARTEADRVFLEVAVDNTAARALYASQGFTEVGRRRDYYKRAGGRIDALVLARDRV